MTTSSHFNCTPRDRALFETGIKMGTIFHQFVGTPVNSETVDHLEETISRSVGAQPYVKDVSVKIDRTNLTKGPYGYNSLVGEMLDVSLTVEHDGVIVKARMSFLEELDYPLMYVEEVIDNSL